jgi:hypothetical protein
MLKRPDRQKPLTLLKLVAVAIHNTVNNVRLLNRPTWVEAKHDQCSERTAALFQACAQSCHLMCKTAETC